MPLRPFIVTSLLVLLGGFSSLCAQEPKEEPSATPTLYLNATLLEITEEGGTILQRLTTAPDGAAHIVAETTSPDGPLSLTQSPKTSDIDPWTLHFPSGGEGELCAGAWISFTPSGLPTTPAASGNATPESDFSGIRLSVRGWADSKGKIVLDTTLATSEFQGFIEIRELTSEGGEALRMLPVIQARSERKTLVLQSGQIQPLINPDLLAQTGYQHRILLLSASTDASDIQNARYNQMMREWCDSLRRGPQEN